MEKSAYSRYGQISKRKIALFGAGLSLLLTCTQAGRLIGLQGKSIVTILKDPLSLFAERSPGGRSSGLLQMTKTAAVPRERVLSTVRDRDAFSNFFSGADVPPLTFSPEAPASIISPPGNNLASSPAFEPFSNFSPFLYPGAAPASQQMSDVPGNEGGGPAVTELPLSTPSSDVPSAESPSEPALPSSSVPEPETWLILIVGLLGVRWAHFCASKRKCGTDVGRDSDTE